MPRYFLHVHDGLVALDPEGIELSDLAAARQEAIAGLRGIVAQKVMAGTVPMHHHIVIANEDGGYIETILFTDALRLID